MSILITGGAGYIGSHTVVELLKKDYKVIIVDDFSNSKPEVLNRIKKITGKNFNFYEETLLNKNGLEEIFKNNEIEAVIHFAGFKAVGESVTNPLKYYHNNISGTVILLELMEKYHVRKIVFSSSATVYGMNNSIPFIESMPLSTTNPYGRTKLFIEEIFQDIYNADSDWSIALLRYFNPIGAHPSGQIGEDPNDIPNNLMPYITQVAVRKRNLLNIFGNDYPTKDGTGVRDFIHVVDLAKGHINALEKVKTNKGIEAYNLGAGKGYSVLEVIKTFEKQNGVVIPYKVVGRRSGDIAEFYADASKAKRELGWEVKLTLDDMVRDSWNWQKNNPDGYK